MLVESIVRKTLGLKRHRVKKITQEHGEIMVYLFPDRGCRVVCPYRVVGMRQPPVNHYSLQEDWLKGLPSFDMKVWIPLENTIYAVEFGYP